MDGDYAVVLGDLARCEGEVCIGPLASPVAVAVGVAIRIRIAVCVASEPCTS